MLGLATQASAETGGSVTNTLNSSYLTTGCHDSLFYFSGWYAPCKGIDVSNGTFGDPDVYLRGYFWTTATVVGVNRWSTYYDTGCTSFAGYEYSQAYQIGMPTGTAGIAFWHLDNYHFGLGAVISNGALIGTRAVTTQKKYYGPPEASCAGRLASDGSHVHIEFASDGDLYNEYGTYAGGTEPYVRYWWP